MTASFFDNPDITQQISELHARLCSALADPRRILILYALSEKPYTVNELAEKVGLSQPATSRHLKTLRDQGLVTATRQGMNVEYALSDHRLIDALETLRLVLFESISRKATLIS
jgi:ArsR family transcriptional regulator